LYCSEDNIPRTNGVLTLLHRSALDPHSSTLVPGRATSTSFSLSNHTYHSINIYSPSNPSPADSPELIIRVVRQFLGRARRQSPQSHIIISGDFNTDMSHPSRTQILYHTLFYKLELLDAFMLISGNDSPTWRGPGLRARQISRIDYVYISNGVGYQCAKVTPNSDSDHHILSLEPASPGTQPRRPTRWILNVLKNPDYQARVMEDLRQTFHRPLPSSPEAIDSFLDWQDFSEGSASPLETLNVILSVMEKNHNHFTHSQKAYSRGAQNLFTDSVRRIEEAIDDSLLNDAGFAASAAELTSLKNTRRDRINQESREAKNYYSLQKARDFGKPTTLAFKSCNSKTFSSISSLRAPSGEIITDPITISNKMTHHHMTNTGSLLVPPPAPAADTPEDEQSFPDHPEYLSFHDLTTQLEGEGFIISEHLSKLDLNDAPFTQPDVVQVLASMKNQSAPGPSGIDKQVLLFLLRTFPKFLLRLVNHISSNPSLHSTQEGAWIKHRHIVFLPKKGADKLEPKSYRPISLLETFYKLLSKLHYNRLQIDPAFSQTQFGFRPANKWPTPPTVS